MATIPGPGHAAGDRGLADCLRRFVQPPKTQHATSHNGVALPDVCIREEGPHHVFVIGDWGGLLPNDGNKTPVPADHRGQKFAARHRLFVAGVDDSAQMRVAKQMRIRAEKSRPAYVLNAGDNFYWGGIKARCGMPPFKQDVTKQWGPIFEDVYSGTGLDGVQWLGVLGNHDYGGFTFTMAWDQLIQYTWGGPTTSTGRWMIPAQYWKSKVLYPDFSVDYYFIDSNVFDTFAPGAEVGHNICSQLHNPSHASCGPDGPTSLCNCPNWFLDLWGEQLDWLQLHLPLSSAEWQVIVTHFPPDWGVEYWKILSAAYGIDLFVTGHQHSQAVYGANAPGNFLGTAWIVSGGGGGITSEGMPSHDGHDDQYGFMDLTLSKDLILIEAISHGGVLRSTTRVQRREPNPNIPKLQPNLTRVQWSCGEAPQGDKRTRKFLNWIQQDTKSGVDEKNVKTKQQTYLPTTTSALMPRDKVQQSSTRDKEHLHQEAPKGDLVDSVTSDLMKRIGEASPGLVTTFRERNLEDSLGDRVRAPGGTHPLDRTLTRKRHFVD